MRKNYMNKANRDKAFAALGGAKAGYRKASIRNQLLHPQYVTDYTQETGRTLSPADCGFGNDVYATFFSALYSIEEVRR